MGYSLTVDRLTSPLLLTIENLYTPWSAGAGGRTDLELGWS